MRIKEQIYNEPDQEDAEDDDKEPITPPEGPDVVLFEEINKLAVGLF